jgi:predicted O-methyltransferase YrrM
MIITKDSLMLLQRISDEINNRTFHHHAHILYDLPIRKNGFYVEIGCYAGATACLMLQRDDINVISIDLGHPIDSSIVFENVKKLNIKNNSFTYLMGNSQTNDMLNRLKELTQEIDILFIDGDHSRSGVLRDFLLYHDLVISDGYIVFDDYNDKQCSPEVKLAVDLIVKDYANDYEVIGALANTFSARPDTLKESNCFILRKHA